MTGGTTVAGTMFLAQKAGISVFGTGGLGGVHRGGQDSMDVSADLTELGRTPVAVISSGCKSFLDIPRTLEYLETQGAGVFTFADGRTGDIDFPAFYTRDSGIKSPMVVQNEKEAAAMICRLESPFPVRVRELTKKRFAAIFQWSFWASFCEPHTSGVFNTQESNRCCNKSGRPGGRRAGLPWTLKYSLHSRQDQRNHQRE